MFDPSWARIFVFLLALTQLGPAIVGRSHIIGFGVRQALTSINLLTLKVILTDFLHTNAEEGKQFDLQPPKPPN